MDEIIFYLFATTLPMLLNPQIGHSSEEFFFFLTISSEEFKISTCPIKLAG
jgi:hypothetical protein